jgi:hypothetical protein
VDLASLAAGGTIPERGDGWTRDLQANLVWLVVAHVPKGTVRVIEAVDGPLAYLSDHRRRPPRLRAGGPAQEP